MSARMTRALVTVIAAALAATTAPIVWAAAGTARPSAAPALQVGPKQFFFGLVNGKFSRATITVICPGVANEGHPLAHQSVAIGPPPAATSQAGFTGKVGTSVQTWLTWQVSKRSPAPSPAFVASFTTYRTVPIPTSITVPCGGPGEMLFLPAPGSPTVRAAVVPVTFANVAR